MNENNNIYLPSWMVHRSSFGGKTKVNEMKPRGKSRIWYALTTHQGERLRDCLKTDDREEAERRLTELRFMVERGEYQKRKELFDGRVAKYKAITHKGINKGKISLDKKNYAQVLLKQFGGKKVLDIDVDAWALEQAEVYSESTCNKHFTVMRELGFKVPLGVKGKPGKRWTMDHILEEVDLVKVLGHVPEKYRDVCRVSILTGLRLGNVIKMSKKDVQATGWIKPVNGQAKTGRPVEVKIGAELARIFSRLPSPLRNDDLYFPDLTGMSKALSTAVRRGFKRAGLAFGSFTHFRHFHACSALDSGHSIEEIQAQLGHSNISQTQVYARVKREKLAKISESIDTKLTQIGKRKIDAL